jgi:hypothetical protein
MPSGRLCAPSARSTFDISEMHEDTDWISASDAGYWPYGLFLLLIEGLRKEYPEGIIAIGVARMTNTWAGSFTKLKGLVRTIGPYFTRWISSINAPAAIPSSIYASSMSSLERIVPIAYPLSYSAI